MDRGQKVILVKANRVYATYCSAFKALGFANQIQNPRFVSDIQRFKGKMFTIFAVGEDKYEGFIGIINENGEELLVQESGLRVAKIQEDFNSLTL